MFKFSPRCSVDGGGAVAYQWKGTAGLDPRVVHDELLVVAAHLLHGRAAAHVARHVVPPVRGVRVVHRQGALEQLVLRLRPLKTTAATSWTRCCLRLERTDRTVRVLRRTGLPRRFVWRQVMM